MTTMGAAARLLLALARAAIPWQRGAPAGAVPRKQQHEPDEDGRGGNQRGRKSIGWGGQPSGHDAADAKEFVDTTFHGIGRRTPAATCTFCLALAFTAFPVWWGGQVNLVCRGSRVEGRGSRVTGPWDNDGMGVASALRGGWADCRLH
ncbi:uncharacterized protein UV8b_05955 [Ustilaginoidea virens]|uniref:Uncharacterized protein n=1 Tax=Ustilaginoidea virens TaxID=1159556 RepID=A0A8E5MJK7_USTVR|nr:uncharacterized protein UV8b_05955 [Ustilaginoidea virens]QUC21712.1 hypothetical protein UV8b_05955 [Ustilaginoidea virens]